MIDLLKCEAGTFTVNLAVNDVAIVPTPSRFYKSIAPGVLQYFQPYESMVIECFYGVLPHAFSTGDGGAAARTLVLSAFQAMDNAAGMLPFIEVTGTLMPDEYMIPVENTEIPINLFLSNDNTLVSLPYALYGQAEGFVSMVGVPAALAAVTFQVWMFARVRHNLPLV